VPLEATLKAQGTASCAAVAVSATTALHGAPAALRATRVAVGNGLARLLALIVLRLGGIGRQAASSCWRTCSGSGSRSSS